MVWLVVLKYCVLLCGEKVVVGAQEKQQDEPLGDCGRGQGGDRAA